MILREPIFHMLILGLLLFGADQMFNPSSDRSEVIEVDAAKIAWLKTMGEKERGRAITDEMLTNLIDRHVDEEVLYREALALNLQSDDVIVRRRLVQKMQFLIEGVSQSSPPDEETLKAFYADNADLFRAPARTSFSHLYFSKDARSDAFADAQAALQGGEGQGDPFMLPLQFSGATPEEIARQFGKGFVAGLAALPVGEWAGPVQSAFGWHIVNVSARRDSAVPPYEAVVDKVLAKWQDEARAKANAEALEKLRQKYDVVITE